MNPIFDVELKQIILLSILSLILVSQYVHLQLNYQSRQ
jgi:hypothetical protein